jgi:probable HAF family extracellular repeat protein
MQCKRKYSVVFAAALLCLTPLDAQSGWHYDFSPAGNFPGAYYSVPLGVSLDHIVGYYVAPSGVSAYVQTGDSFVDAAPPGAVTSYLYAINSRGMAVGGYCPYGCTTEAGLSGYLYDSATGKTEPINFPMKDVATTAYGINDSGVIVGGYCPMSLVCPQTSFTNHGFIDDHGVFTTLDFPNALTTSLWGINNAGAIVGYYQLTASIAHAFVYQNGTFTTIDFPRSFATLALSINNLGAVAGLIQHLNTGEDGFVYYDGHYTQIDKPNATATVVTGINDRNEVIGLWYPILNEYAFKAIPVAPGGVP